MTKFKCKKCEKNFKILTKEDLCAYCSYEINKEWPKEFIGKNKGVKN